MPGPSDAKSAVRAALLKWWLRIKFIGVSRSQMVHHLKTNIPGIAPEVVIRCYVHWCILGFGGCWPRITQRRLFQ